MEYSSDPRKTVENLAKFFMFLYYAEQAQEKGDVTFADFYTSWVTRPQEKLLTNRGHSFEKSG